jgi:hypothetical protein
MSYTFTNINASINGNGQRASVPGILPARYTSAPNIIISTQKIVKNYKPAGIVMRAEPRPPKATAPQKPTYN